ncbi:MAG: type II CRISPR RNA-guided endonuclease Cas9 [Candidatus Cryptobacteroides sp.]|jgi:CRISPR-associated endonuclease Csn1
MKKILGLDLGTTSIGWALVNQAENEAEKSSIIKAGVRVNPLTTDEKDAFTKGKAITTNSERTLKRGMRRTLQRYKLRRDALKKLLIGLGWIDETTLLSESGNNAVFETYRLRAQAASSEISLSDFARVLLMINKKRGYKSNRKTESEESGHLIDAMTVAKLLADEGLTPGQYCLNALKKGVKLLPDFYRSDLVEEFERIWKVQAVAYPDLLTDQFKQQIQGKSRTGVSKIFYAKYQVTTADNKGKEKRYQSYEWRVRALDVVLPIEQMAYVIADLNGEIAGSSGYLGEISDRSKELFFLKQTVGQYLYENILKDSNFSVRNKVFYRQDYQDEFNVLWECQSKFHPELTAEIKKEIRDRIIFYQRPLRSQKGLVSFCEFESREIKVVMDGKETTKIRGCRVAPKSSPLFQEFKIWQILNNLVVTDRMTGEVTRLEPEEMELLAEELKTKDKMSAAAALKLLFKRPTQYELNYASIEGDRTFSAICAKLLEIVALAGYGEYDIRKLRTQEVLDIIEAAFKAEHFNVGFLSFDSSLDKTAYESQLYFKLWHLLYSYEGDGSKTGDTSLIEKIGMICGLPAKYARILAGVRFQEEYGSLSHKAMTRILPFLKAGNEYSLACRYVGYNHSHSMTREETENKVLVDRLTILKKNSLRNPVVEKILNQMINVVNAVGDVYGRPDEIHIEMARELKANASEREKISAGIETRTKENERIANILRKELKFTYVSRADIIRYRLYEELKGNGYKTLYSNRYIPREKIFSDEIDVDHIIPKALLYDDSFSNKTLEYKDINIEKGKQAAFDFVLRKYGDNGATDYQNRIEDLFLQGAITKAKRNKLLIKTEDLPENFIARDLSNTQYIARKALEILNSFVRVVLPTSGAITDYLREEWQLIDVMRELNLPKYQKAGLTTVVETHSRKRLERIQDWTKRNDHRHHAMDAITIAFTRPQHIQYLNSVSAKSDDAFRPYLYSSNGKWRFVPPIPLPELRREVREQLEAILVSIKAKNKVTTENINRTKTKNGSHAVTVLTPRGQLHKEFVYGVRKRYQTYPVSVGSGLTPEVISTVASKQVREALSARLETFGGDPKKAFTGVNSMQKNPIWLDEARTKAVGKSVKCVRFITAYSIRKPIDPNLTLEKVADGRIRQILERRLADFGGKPTKAFVNLDENPIWYDSERRIPLKRVTITENFNLDPIRLKHDVEGQQIRDSQGNPVPSDYVNYRSNHHIAIFRDKYGKLQEQVVPFFDAVGRKTEGLPVVDKEYNKDAGWEFLFSMKLNEMFVFPNPDGGFDPQKIDLMDPGNAALISPNLFRVQKLTSKDYVFRHHLETIINYIGALRDVTWKRVGISGLNEIVKVRINHLGQIVSVGEYD